MNVPIAISHRGQGSVEFLVAAAPLLLLGLGCIEAIHWHFTRQAVSLALSQAAREGIARHADPVVVDQAFMQALLPLHAAPTATQSRARLERNMRRRTESTGLPAWRIVIRSPSEATFRDFASRDPDLPRHDGLAVFDNDYLPEQHQKRLAQGWAHGRGPISGQTTLEANVLILQLTWLHEPLLPGVRQLLRQLAPADSRYGSLAMARGGYLPIRREVAFVMQSHPIAWPMPAHGRVMRATGATLDTVYGQRTPAAAPPTPEAGQPPAAGSAARGGNTAGSASAGDPRPWAHGVPASPPADHIDTAAGGLEKKAGDEAYGLDDCPGCCD